MFSALSRLLEGKYIHTIQDVNPAGDRAHLLETRLRDFFDQHFADQNIPIIVDNTLGVHGELKWELDVYTPRVDMLATVEQYANELKPRLIKKVHVKTPAEVRRDFREMQDWPLYRFRNR